MSDMLGYAASCAVLVSFLMRTMVPLRLVAILSNVLFAAFGYVQNIHPVLLLHIVLLPINIWRLFAIPQALHALGRFYWSLSGGLVTARTYALWLGAGLLVMFASLLAYLMVVNPHHV